MPAPTLYIGLMSGTSMDGVDAVLASMTGVAELRILGSTYLPFPPSLRAQLFALQATSDNEIHCEALAANQLAVLYADAVAELLRNTGVVAADVRALGAHGQTIRHRPEYGYTRQIGNAALLAELSDIDVVADFRSRDIAAGGQGAPLVPAFHQAVFGDNRATRVVANIGGIANITVLHPTGEVIGFDTGPGNVLLDLWCARHCGLPYDADGAWARSGKVVPDLLQALLAEPYLNLPPPKSTGRDLFHDSWLDKALASCAAADAKDVQATLAAFTAHSLAEAISRHAPSAESIYVCGGGAHNSHLLEVLAAALNEQECAIPVRSTEELGIPPNQVEASAFAWLAACHVNRHPANLPAVTGAKGPRILGALFPGN